MKIRFFLLPVFLFLLLVCPPYGFAGDEYRELNTSSGKIIVGMDREEALEKFGLPDQAAERLWHYSFPESFFVVFPAQSVSKIYLYPRHPYGFAGMPLEFRIFGYNSDTELNDITEEAELLIDTPKDFTPAKGGVIIPRKAGEYQVLARYKNIFSNPAYIRVEEPRKEETEKLISINILPYRPVIPYQGQLDFAALGVFQDPTGQYFIKDITSKANWYVRQDREIIKNRKNKVFGVSIGEAELFCKYLNLDSYPQEVSVQEKAPGYGPALKHITLLPELTMAAAGKKINFMAFATYRNNRTEEITRQVRWETSDQNLLILTKAGEFLTKAVGVAELTAVMGGAKSGAAKIIIADEYKGGVAALPPEKKIDPKELLRDIQNEAGKLKESLSGGERKLTLIKIIPDALEIPLGETGEVKASGFYSDNSQEDLTHFGEWSSSDHKVVKVSGGKIGTFSQGEAMIYMKFKDIKSLPAAIKVGGANLLSIILSPENLQISMRDRPVLKAGGYFSDSSRKEITSLVAWEFTKPGIIKMEEGNIYPLKFGKTRVSAGYSGIKSLPADITVIITMGWVIYMALKGALFLFLGITALFFILYLLTEKERNRLKNSMNNAPREFIINLYENMKRILDLFNLRHMEWMTLSSYAVKVQEKYSIQDNLFSKFSDKLEEVKYSNHPCSSEDASMALKDYNNLLKTIFIRHNKVSMFFKYCLALLHRRPLFIPNP